VNPVIGIILLFVLSVAFAVAAIVNGDPGANRYGPASK
jgi:uncharacterized membrane protein YhaH (DUF805 family)